LDNIWTIFCIAVTSIIAVLQCNALLFITLEVITREFWLCRIIVAEIKDIFKERKAEDILDIEPKLVALVDSRVVGNNRVLDTIELDAEINMPAEDDIKLIEFNNTIVDMFVGDAVVNKAISVVDIKLSSIDAGVTAFQINCSI